MEFDEYKLLFQWRDIDTSGILPLMNCVGAV